MVSSTPGDTAFAENARERRAHCCNRCADRVIGANDQPDLAQCRNLGKRELRVGPPGWCSSSSTCCISTATMSACGPLIERKARLAELLSGVAPPLHYSDY